METIWPSPSYQDMKLEMFSVRVPRCLVFTAVWGSFLSPLFLEDGLTKKLLSSYIMLPQKLKCMLTANISRQTWRVTIGLRSEPHI